MRRGLTQHIQQLARELATIKIGAGLFPEVEGDCREYNGELDRLDGFLATIDTIRNQYTGPSELGGLKS
jgi:hypothetical protein